MKNKQLESRKRLEHIKKAIADIESFVQNESKHSFCNNNILNNAVLYNFTIMGEAVVHIETDLLAKFDYPWYKVRSFRNMIAHEYFNIKMSAVWEIIKTDIPQLKDIINSMLEKEF